MRLQDRISLFRDRIHHTLRLQSYGGSSFAPMGDAIRLIRRIPGEGESSELLIILVE
jgi:hypothetical protein